MSKIIKVWQVGRLNYSNSLALQKHITHLHYKNEENADTLLMLEHNPVYTIGVRRKEYTPEDEKRLKKMGAEFYRTNRGGLITFHGPGQLVAYPIINLKNYKTSIRWYVNNIEETVIYMCKMLNLNAGRSPHTGVWIGDNKLCAIGIHASRYVTTHGLAINCNTDLKWFDHIVPCGIEGKGVTSLSKELNRTLTIEEAIPLFVQSFSKVFNCSYINYPEEETSNILSQIQNCEKYKTSFV